VHIINIEKLSEIAEIEFSDIIEDVIPGLNRLRILLREGSFIDIWYSITNPDRYACHWERKSIDGTIYRHNNAPHKDWEKVSTYPKHFHNGTEDRVEASEIPDNPVDGLRYFLRFVESKIKIEEGKVKE